MTYIALLHAAQDFYRGLILTSVSFISSPSLQIHTKLKKEKACREPRHKGQAGFITLFPLLSSGKSSLAAVYFTHIYLDDGTATAQDG